MLYQPDSHQTLKGPAWDPDLARAAIVRLLTSTLDAYSPIDYWPLAGEAEVGENWQGQPPTSIYGSVIVLIHDSSASLHAWEPWIEEIGGDYRVVTLDLPGHGLTGGVPDNVYSSAAQLNTVAAVVAHLGIDQFVLGGNSMGGGVT
jgi:pimeloyl-ACP methyl ester carboxylesterase